MKITVGHFLLKRCGLMYLTPFLLLTTLSQIPPENIVGENTDD